MNFWLVKSEPSAWSWADQLRDGTTAWTGVRNHQAARNLRAMAQGDRAFFYHSVTEKMIVGVVTVTRTAYPDPTDPTGYWPCVDLTLDQTIPHPLSLADIKADPDLADLPLVRQARLSVMPIPPVVWHRLCQRMGVASGQV